MMRSKIKIGIIFTLALTKINSLGLAQTTVTVPDTVLNIIQQVQHQYCPDKRIGRFEVTARLDSNKIILSGETLSAEGKTELIQRLESETHYQIKDSLSLLPDSALGDKIYGLVKISVAQLRRQPDEIHEIVDQALMGSVVKILKIKDKYWVYCQLDDQYLGWMTISSLNIGNYDLIKQWKQREKLIVSANYGQIWEQRKEPERSVSDVVLGNLLVNKGKKRGWYQVELPDGRKGYINASSVTPEKPYFEQVHLTAASMIKMSYRFLGLPYLWGGRSTKGFDCSGFTQTIYKMHGITLPRDANMQVKIGIEVTIDDAFSSLKPGDLLFFGRDINHIFHVGMYIGDYQFIHSDGMVRINSFNRDAENYSDYRRRGLQAVRRVLGN